MTRFATPDRRVLLLSIVLQLALALLLGHSYDTRIFMGTGYLVGSGQNPYLPQDLTPVFHHIYFTSLTTIGYPPPWPLVLGLLYRLSYALTHDLLVYNLAIKLPVVAANIGLAYLTAAVLQDRGAPVAVARKAWAFLLLNPFLLYFGAAWGQIDSIVALFSLLALVLLFAQRRGSSALLLALAVSVKPTALPIVLVAVVFLWRGSARRAVRYAAVFAGGVFLFCVAPFLVLRWSPELITQRWNAQFITNGALSPMTVIRVLRDPLVLTGRWWLVGMIWVPALALGLLALRRADGSFEDLLKKSTGLVLIFFLTRAWLSEPNVILVLPMVLILTSLGRLDRRALTAVWVLPLAFTVCNSSPLQLLFVTFPQTMQNALDATGRYHVVALVARAVLVIGWQIAGWSIVVACLRRNAVRARESDNAVGGLAS